MLVDHTYEKILRAVKSADKVIKSSYLPQDLTLNCSKPRCVSATLKQTNNLVRLSPNFFLWNSKTKLVLVSCQLPVSRRYRRMKRFMLNKTIFIHSSFKKFSKMWNHSPEKLHGESCMMKETDARSRCWQYI